MVQSERLIHSKLDNPYFAKLFYAFQTKTSLYLVMEYINGGELFSHIKKKGNLSEERARQHAAEVVEILIYLHKHGIIYRDLKPENLLVDKLGHIRIIDMGMAKSNMRPDELTFSIAGTTEYLAPELITQGGYSF